MKCADCGKDNDTVIDSRALKGGRIIRRRRKCLVCDARWTTHEMVIGKSPIILPVKQVQASIKSMHSTLIKLDLKLGLLIHETEDNEGSEDPVADEQSIHLGTIPETPQTKRPPAR